MTEDIVRELGNIAEQEFPNSRLSDRCLLGGDDPGPQQVTFAGLAICNSDLDLHCGLSVVPADRAPETIAATDDVPVRVDWLEHELREGPGLGADPGEMLVIRDLAADGRWPDFGRMCVAVLNVRSMASVPISVAPPDRARLNFYSSDPCALDQIDSAAALRLAGLAAPIVTDVISEFGESLLRAAPGDCSRVAIAVGTVIARYRVSSADAFDLLREASQDLGRALLSVADDVVAQGRLPDEAIIRARRRRAAEGVPGQARDPVTAPCWPRRNPGESPALPDPAGRNPRANGAPSIGGPEMWHDPSARDNDRPDRVTQRPAHPPGR